VGRKKAPSGYPWLNNQGPEEKNIGKETQEIIRERFLCPFFSIFIYGLFVSKLESSQEKPESSPCT
jgi:hypothetical protein